MKALLGIAKAAPATLFRRPARLKVVTPGLSPPPPMSSVAKLLRRARERELQHHALKALEQQLELAQERRAANG